MKTVLVSALVLNGSRSGYRRIIKNMILHHSKKQSSIRYIYVFQKSGWESLNLDTPIPENCKVIIFKNFNSKWLRGIVEQLVVPLLAVTRKVDSIFMPATFGLFFPVKPTITFIHTNTHFAVDSSLRGRSRIQQYAHNILTTITKFTSSKLAFTTERTYLEYIQECNTPVPHFILGNGILVPNRIENYTLPHNLAKENYFLSVSQFYRLKNFDSLILAFIKFKDLIKMESPHFKLVIIGTIQEQDYYENLREICRNRNDIYFFHNLSDEVLDQLYVNARGYCFYSKFEGYSLTPGEALLAGLNIAISDIPTHQEVYKKLPIYADPYNIDSITESLIKLYNSHPLDTNNSIYEDVIKKLSFDKFMVRLESLF
jgi:glycosyltransferase involved in cell wall biosynthesis